MMCTTPLKTLLELEVSRRPMTARKLGFSHLIEHPTNKTLNYDQIDVHKMGIICVFEQPEKALNYVDTKCAKMEAERRPRAAARMNKYKK